MGPTVHDILVVDDDPAMVRLIEKVLTSAGFQVRSAQNGYDALEKIRAQCPDVVISDWEMPGMTGPALSKAIRKESLPKYVLVVLLTVKTADADMIEGLEAGADDFISKPINAPVLLARLRAGVRVLEMEARLRDSATRDPLTGIMNRRTFHERLCREWERTSRYRRALSCVLIDLDYFKRINDTHGHAAGDAALVSVANALAGRHRPCDLVCRYGGEEFCVILPETDEVGAAAWAERTRAAIAELSFPIGESEGTITASLGVAERLADTASPEALIDLADQALAVAKRSGRNRVVRHSSLLDPAIQIPGGSGQHSPLDRAFARDIMTPAVVCPSIDDTLARVTEVLLQMRINSVPLVEQNGQLAGIASEIDVANAVACGSSWDHPVRMVMKSTVPCFDEQVPARQVLDFLTRVSMRRVVVVREGKPIGVISRASILQWLRNWTDLLPPVCREARPSAVIANPSTRREDAARIVDAAQNRLSQLREAIADETADFVPGLVAETSRLQELLSDLLGQAGAGPMF